MKSMRPDFFSRISNSSDWRMLRNILFISLSLYSNFSSFKALSTISDMILKILQIIIILPLNNYVRGNSRVNFFFIVDEIPINFGGYVFP